MATVFEGRLDNTVDAGSIGIGETVDVRTKMGHCVASGEVVASTPFGISLSTGGFFESDMYLFAPIEEDPPVSVANQLLSSPDDRVAAKMAEFGLSVDEAEKLDDKEGSSESPKDDDGDDDEEDEKELEKKKKKVATKKKDDQGDDEPLAKPDSSVDVDALPEDIKKAVVSTTQMDDDQLNSVLSETSDAFMKSLKRVNVKETELYSVTDKVQKAIYVILTGKPVASPVGSKKGKTK